MSSRSTGEWLEAIHEQVSRIADHVVGEPMPEKSEHIEAEQEDAVAFLREEADDQKARAEKAEAERDAALDERDGWKDKYAALRKDVEALRNGYRDRPNDSVSRIHPHAVARHVDWYVLGHDDERVPQPDVTNAPADDPDEQVDTEAEQLRVGIKALVEDKSQHLHVTREIPGATVTEYNDPLVRTSRIRALLDQRRD